MKQIQLTLMEECNTELVSARVSKSISLFITSPHLVEGGIIVNTRDEIDMLIDKLQLAREIMVTKKEKWDAMKAQENIASKS